MFRYPENGALAVDPRPLTVGQQVLLDSDPNPWTVQAVTENFAALTRAITDQDRADDEHDTIDPDEKTFYTVLDWYCGVRGPCNLSGWGYGDGTYSPAECAQMLAEFEAGDLEVTQRNWTRIRFAEEPVR